MLTLNNIHWYIVWSIIALILGTLSLGYDWYPQFPSMCLILGIVLAILIDTLEPIPPIRRHNWDTLYADIKAGKIDIGRGFLLLHSKVIFPTIFTIYLILLILQKIKVVPIEWQSYATSAIDTLELLWVTLISAIVANFTGLPENSYESELRSPLINTLTIILICLLSYGAMWAVFVEIAAIGRVAYFVSLSVGVLIAMVSCMILTEPDEEVVENLTTKTS